MIKRIKYYKSQTAHNDDDQEDFPLHDHDREGSPMDRSAHPSIQTVQILVIMVDLENLVDMANLVNLVILMNLVILVKLVILVIW